ncbi:MAG: tetratricopeptide repeat protein, partial [Anaerolineales bacterium]|nr:tetratricopeptide repeat protein [Anaerolineales bacterium]
ESLACRRTFNDPLLVTGSLNNLGLVAYALGDYEAARVYHEEALQVRQQFGLEGWLCQSRSNLALTLIRLGELAEAETLAIASLQLAQRQQLKMSKVEVCEVLALIAAQRQQVARAACLLGAATRLRQVFGAPRDGPQEKDVVWLKEMLSTAVDNNPTLWHQNWAIGQQLTLDQMTAIALEDANQPTIHSPATHLSF